MEAKLIKEGSFGYKIKFYNDDDMAACALGLLSLKNCEAIERGYDLDELAYSHLVNINDSTITTSWQGYTEDIFKAGFQKALELMDKKFSEGDLRRAYSRGKDLTSEDRFKFAEWEIFTKLVDSLQQNEWDVEVEMECLDKNCDGINRKGCCIPGDKPKIDSEGYLILKRL